MFSKKSAFAPRLRAALFCFVGCAATVFNFAGISAQTTRSNAAGRSDAARLAPPFTATLTDAFPDPDGDGKPRPGAEITYTATITNDGVSDVVNARFISPVDGNSTLVADSIQVQRDLSSSVVRCTFSTASGGGGNCDAASGAFGQLDPNNYVVIGGQGSRFNVATTDISYNSATGVFAFDATVQNLLAQSLGTDDGTTVDAAGVRLFLNSATVTAGNGIVTAANADGSANFLDAQHSYFQYNGILAQNQTTAAKTLQINVPNTVSTFTVDFLISTKVQAKLVINEVLANPGGTISDANGEWFELYNAGLFPVNIKNFLINDLSASNPTTGCTVYPCERDSHTLVPIGLTSVLTIEPGGYIVLGNTINTTNNGGVPVAYAYGSALTLANSQDGVRIQSPNAVTLDKVTFASAAISAQNGISRELIDPSLDNLNMDGSNWQDASFTTVYGPGGRGTPGLANSSSEIPRSNTVVKEMPRFVTNSIGDAPSGGETVAVTVGTLAVGQTAIVTFRLTIASQVTAPQITTQGTIVSDNMGDVVSNDPSTVDGNDATVTEISFEPTAAEVSIVGRVVTPDELGLTNALVTLTDTQGRSRSVKTGKFGSFRFAKVLTGEAYIISVTSKRYTYAPQIIAPTEDLYDITFTPIQ